jgi:cytochrome P450
MRTLIDERRRTVAVHHDVLSHVLTLRDTAGNAASDEEIIDELLSVFFGATAVGISLGWALYLIASHPEVQSRMAHEASEASRESPGGDMALLPYAQAVIKETLRLYPASWGQPRWTEQRIRLGDATIPPKSLIIPMVSHVQRDPRYWKNPESFNPDRFLSGVPTPAHPFAYFPFSAGPRVCVGAGLAPIVMQRVLVGILSRYKISFVPRFAGDPTTDFSFGITPKDEIRIRIEPR